MECEISQEPDMTPRTAIQSDASAIADIWNPIIRDTTVTFTTSEKTIETLEQLISDRRNAGLPFLVAEAQGKTCGFATATPFRDGPGYRYTLEHTIMLDPKSAGQGFGPILFNALEESARNYGAHSLIGGISGENEGAIRFHKKMGFDHKFQIPQAGRKFDRWIDLVLMQKFI